MTLSESRKISLAWTIALYGFPIGLISLFALIATIDVNGSYIEYWLSMSVVLSTMTFGFFNTMFGFVSMDKFWEKFTIREKTVFFIFAFCGNVLNPYFYRNRWLSEGVDIYSIKDKKLAGGITYFFLFFVMVSISLPKFIAGHTFG